MLVPDGSGNAAQAESIYYVNLLSLVASPH